MIDETKREIRSRELALKLYDRWVRQRQHRPSLQIPTDDGAYQKLGLKNLVTQLVEPRKEHLAQLKEVAKEMSISDKVALLVMLELPVIETSTLLHKLSRQLAENADAPYFSRINQNDNCGSGCG